MLLDSVPEGFELYWLLISAFCDYLGLVSVSFSSLLGSVSQNGILLSDEIRIVSLKQNILAPGNETFMDMLKVCRPALTLI